METLQKARFAGCIAEALLLSETPKEAQVLRSMLDERIEGYHETQRGRPAKKEDTTEAPGTTKAPAATKKKATSKKKTTKKKVPAKKQSVAQLVAELPDGDMEILNSPFHLLEALPFERQAVYLSSLNPSDVVSAATIAAASKQGAKKALFNILIAQQKVERTPVENPMAEYPEKTQTFIANAIEIIGVEGSDLFNHMGLAGVNKEVLLDFKAIAQAVRAGNI